MSRHAIFVGLIGMIFVSPILLAPISLYDGGLVGSAGTFLLHGALPYRDFWWLYGPLAPVLAALPIATFGPSVLLIRLFGLVIVGVQTGVGYLLLRPVMAHIPATLISVGAAASATFFLGLDATAWSLAVALALAALLVRLRYPERPVLAGLLVGAVFLARLDVGGYALIAGMLAGDRRRFAIGFAAVAVPFTVLAALLAGVPTLYDQLVLYPIVGPRQFRSLPWPPIPTPAAALLVLAAVFVPKLAIAGAAIRLAVGPERPRAVIVVTAFAALCQLQVLGRGDLYHHAQASVPAYVALGLAGASLLVRVRTPLPRARVFARLFGFALLSSATALTLMTGALGPIHVQSGPLPRTDVALIAGIRTIKNNTTADEPIFVGLTRHRHTLINDMIAYYLAGRRSGVHVAMFNPGVSNTFAVQSTMAADLATSGTALLLLDDAWADAFERDNSSAIPGATVLDEAIAARYVVVCDFDTIKILATPDRASTITCAGMAPDERLIDVIAGVRVG
jgi:hypothetical protein